jgi:hypothetical protein
LSCSSEAFTLMMVCNVKHGGCAEEGAEWEEGERWRAHAHARDGDEGHLLRCDVQ